MGNLEVFIDEAGDEGIEIEGASRWFIVGAVIMGNEDLPATGEAVQRIRRKMGKDQNYVLQWKRLRNRLDTKLYISQQYALEDFLFTSVVVDTEHPKIMQSRALRQKGKLYNYATRYLVERISWLAQLNKRAAHLTFEHRSSLNYDDMRKYFRILRGQDTKIAWDYVDCENFDIVPKPKSKHLQIADNCCGMIWDALDPDSYGNPHPEFAMNLAPNLHMRGTNLFSYGMKTTPQTSVEILSEFPYLQSIIDAKKKWIGPGRRIPQL